MRPSTPPAAFMRLKAGSLPSFIWRPRSLAEPENGATIPKRISRSVTPRTFEAEARGAAGATLGVTAATVAGGAAAAAAGGGGGGRGWVVGVGVAGGPVLFHSFPPATTALRPSVT